MKRYYERHEEEGGGFSTIFGDLVFGLLFVFFLLAIALVFNRPDVDAFHNQVDDLQRQIHQAREQMEQIKKEKAEVEARIANQKDEARQKDRLLQEREEDIQRHARESKEHIQGLSERRKRLDEAHKRLRADHKDLQARFNTLRASRDTVKASLQRQIDRQQEEISQLRRELDEYAATGHERADERERRHQDAADAVFMLRSFKELLTSAGLSHVLAELERMERILAERQRFREGKSDEELFSDYRLNLAYDPRFKDLEGELWQGDRKISSYLRLNEKELAQLAKELMAEYQSLSKGYTELEKVEHRPRVLLRVHPDTPYGDVQEILNRIRRTIPISIVPWENQ